MKLQLVPARTGFTWIKLGIRTFLRQPLALTGLFFMFMAAMTLVSKLPLIGVGGISSPEQAYAKICAGASAVQIYTSMVYQGLSVACDIAKGLDTLLARDGFATVAQAIGTQRDAWL